MNPCLQAALDFQARGLSPTLCNDKTPIGGKQWHRRTWTADEIRAAFDRNANLNVGIQLGQASGLIDIEADSPDEEADYQELVEGHVLRTPSFQSRRGAHRLFRVSPELHAVGKATLKYRKLAIRVGAKAAQSIMPPSAGRTWIVDLDCEPAELPPDVVQRILDAQPKPAAAIVAAPASGSIAAAVKAMLRKKMIDHGDGSKRLYSYACTAIEHNLTDADAIAAIQAAAAEQPFPRDWSPAEIIVRLRDAEKVAVRGSAVRTRPRIDVTSSALERITADVWQAVETCNRPRLLFRHGGSPVRIERGDHGEPLIRSIDFDRLRHHLAAWIEFYKRKKNKDDKWAETRTAPPKDLVHNVLATPDMPLPILRRISEAPVFAADGSLQTEPGYHAASCMLYAPAADFAVPNVPETPSPADVERACDLLLGELLGDFPFVSDAERAHALSLLLLPFARALIDGPTPLYLIEKPAPGTGATLLVNVLCLPAIGRPASTMTEGRDEEEWRKRITAALRNAPILICIDNLCGRLDSPAVASAITAPIWEDRLLGSSTILKLPVNNAWIGSGNNPTVSAEIARRTIRIRLDAKVDRPWLRDGFRHADLRAWAMTNRGDLVWAALTLIRGWLAAGRPEGSKSLGMFESWSKVMGGILDVAGVPGFLENLTDFYTAADAEGASLRAFVAAWWTAHGSTEVKSQDLLTLAVDEAALPPGAPGEHSQRIRLGRLVGGMRDRTFDLDDVRLKVEQAAVRQRANCWRLVKV